MSLSLRLDAPDRSIVFTGDTGPCQTLEAFASGAQLLVGEIIDVEGTVDMIRKQNPQMDSKRKDMMAEHLSSHHLAPEQLGTLAHRTGVDKVVAVHITLDAIDDAKKSEFTTKIASKFNGEITISEDLGRY